MKNTITAVGIMLFTALVCAGVQQKVTENLKQITESQAAAIANHTLSVKKLNEDAAAAKLEVQLSQQKLTEQEKLANDEKAYCEDMKALLAQLTREKKELATVLSEMLTEIGGVTEEKEKVAKELADLFTEKELLAETIPAPVVVEVKAAAPVETVSPVKTAFSKLTVKVSELFNK